MGSNPSMIFLYRCDRFSETFNFFRQQMKKFAVIGVQFNANPSRQDFSLKVFPAPNIFQLLPLSHTTFVPKPLQLVALILLRAILWIQMHLDILNSTLVFVVMHET